MYVGEARRASGGGNGASMRDCSRASFAKAPRRGGAKGEGMRGVQACAARYAGVAAREGSGLPPLSSGVTGPSWLEFTVFD